MLRAPEGRGLWGKHLEDMASKALVPWIEEMFPVLWEDHLTSERPCYTPLKIQEAQEQVGSLIHHRWRVTTDGWLPQSLY